MNNNTNRTILTAGNIEVKIDHHPRFGYKRPTKARVYVSGNEDVDYIKAYALMKELDPQNQGVSPEVNALFRKLNRQEVKNMKAVIEEALQTVEGLDFLADNSLTFSKKAGCGCGCSPAFVVKEGVQHDGLWVKSIFITLKK